MDAEKYFTLAVQLNPRSPILFVYLGMTAHAQNKKTEALDYFNKAERLDKNNPLCKYQKANVLFALDRYKDTLKVLE